MWPLKLVKTGKAATNIAEQTIQLMTKDFFRRGVIPQTQKYPFQAAITPFAFPRKSLTESGEAAIYQAHPDLLKARLPAKTKVRGITCLCHQLRDPIRLRVAQRGEFLAEIREQSGLGNARRLLVGADGIERAGQGGLKGYGGSLRRKPKLIHPAIFARSVPKVIGWGHVRRRLDLSSVPRKSSC